MEDGLASQTNVYISIEQLVISDVNILANKTVHEIEIHKDQEKEEFKVLQLKDNIFPRELSPLEELFDFSDFAKKPKMEPTRTNIEKCNIGSEQNPKIIKTIKIIVHHSKTHVYISI